MLKYSSAVGLLNEGIRGAILIVVSICLVLERWLLTEPTGTDSAVPVMSGAAEDSMLVEVTGLIVEVNPGCVVAIDDICSGGIAPNT